MYKIFILSLMVNYVVPAEVFLARMVVLSKGIGKHSYIEVKKVGDGTGKKPFNEKACTCEKNEALDNLEGVQEKKFYYGEDLSVSWTKDLYLYKQSELTGRMTIKYDSDKYEDVNTGFALCKDIYKLFPKNNKSNFAKDIFFRIFVKQYDSNGCIESRNVEVGDGYYFERSKENFFHCDANATIRFDLYSTFDADCGIGGSGESFTNNVFRVLFNAKFDDCDGQKYALLDGFPGLDLAKLSAANSTITRISDYPVIV